MTVTDTFAPFSSVTVTLSPSLRPSSADPMGEDGDMISVPSDFSSMWPIRYVSAMSGESPSKRMVTRLSTPTVPSAGSGAISAFSRMPMTMFFRSFSIPYSSLAAW
ncbi:MAG: hypothetical protein EBT79_00225 [Actinobacteria bacterium]|nr:hypothetical protein [Actinomycetota bacterium]